MMTSDDLGDVVAEAELLTQSVARLREAGPDDPALWALKREIALKVLAAGGISAAELEAIVKQRRDAEQSGDG